MEIHHQRYERILYGIEGKPDQFYITFTFYSNFYLLRV
jgi:hypothetical protein